MSFRKLEEHRETWKKKFILRKIYSDWFSLITEELVKGKTLELGSGPGFFKDYFNEAISTDIIVTPWNDCAVDATKLPFRNETFGNIVMIDVLHHIQFPRNFFHEAVRILSESGRILIFDVQITPLSYPVYKFFHQEPVDFKADPLSKSSIQSGEQPFDSNQAITTLIFKEHFSTFKKLFPQLSLKKKQYLSFFAYPLSGGFDHTSMVPESVLLAVQRWEKLLAPLSSLFAFRNLIILEKITPKL